MSGEVQHDSEVPAHGQQVISACAFIYHKFDDELKVFLPKRADTKKFLPGVYELPGGHIDFGEDIEAGLKREIKEEFNREIELGAPFAAFTYMNEIKGSQATIEFNPEDHSGYDWFSEQDVRDRRSEIVPTEHVIFEHEDDPEYLNVLRGFTLLKAESNPFLAGL